jgi:5-methyltetrahydropteroyltriglutamate--homocysteine methyltransferase
MMADRDYREQYLDAVAAFFSDQNRAGLDILVDGDARLDGDFGGRSWFAYAFERLTGVEEPHVGTQFSASVRDKKPGDIGFEVIETRLPPFVRGKVGRGALEYAANWRVMQGLAAKPLKFGAISGGILEGLMTNVHYKDRRDLIMDLSAVMNEELHTLADAGCPIIQIEDPPLHLRVGIVDDPQLTPDFYVAAFNREVRGLRDKTEVWCHTCWGSPLAQRVEHIRTSYKPSLPYLNQLDVDVLTFEAADDQGQDIEAIAKAVSKDKKIALGAASHRTLQVERPEQVAALIRRALTWIEPERLILSTDCGFGRQGMSRTHALYKMVAIVAGTNIVRRELGLAEVPIPLMDERFHILQR